MAYQQKYIKSIIYCRLKHAVNNIITVGLLLVTEWRSGVGDSTHNCNVARRKYNPDTPKQSQTLTLFLTLTLQGVSKVPGQVKFRKDPAEEDGIQTATSPQICCCTTLWKVSGQLYSFTALSIQFTVMQTFNYGKCSRRMLFLCFSIHMSFCHMFKMSASAHMCVLSREFQWSMYASMCVVQCCAKLFLHYWKEWVMQQPKYCTNVIMTSVSERKIKNICRLT